MLQTEGPFWCHQADRFLNARRDRWILQNRVILRNGNPSRITKDTKIFRPKLRSSLFATVSHLAGVTVHSVLNQVDGGGLPLPQ